MLRHIEKKWLWLRNLFRSHIKRILLSVLVAIPLITFGAWLLHFEVTQNEVHPLAAYLLNWPLITGMAFVSNRWLLWHDRETGVWVALRRWVVASIGHSLISYSVFVLLVQVFGWQYLVVSLCLTAALGLGSYIVRNLWIFAVMQRVRVAVTA